MLSAAIFVYYIWRTSRLSNIVKIIRGGAFLLKNERQVQRDMQSFCRYCLAAEFMKKIQTYRIWHVVVLERVIFFHEMSDGSIGLAAVWSSAIRTCRDC